MAMNASRSLYIVSKIYASWEACPRDMEIMTQNYEERYRRMDVL